MRCLRAKLLSSQQPQSRLLFVLTLAALSAVGLISCTPKPTASSDSTSPQAQVPPAADDELKVVTATLAVTNFTKAVAGDRVEVTYLLPTNASPHDYQAKPEDVRTLAQADVLVKNGLGIEEYLDDLIANANNQNLKIIDTSEGIQTLSSEEHEGEEHEEGEGHDQEEFGPHIWLDPKRAVQQVENIRDGLIAADPDGEATYTANAANYIDRLKALDREIADALKPYAGQEFVSFHDFAFYFAQSYNLRAERLVGLPEENPSPADVKRVIDTVKKSDIKTLLAEAQAGGSPFEALAKDLDVKVSIFDPIETSGPEGVEPDYYFTVMRQNLKNLQTAFGVQSVQSSLPEWSPASTFTAVATQPVRLGW